MRARHLIAVAATLAVGCDGLLLEGPARPGPLPEDPWSEWRPTGPDAPPRTAATDPGRVTLRRLNRTELDHTVRDVLGIERSVSADFPADDRGYGFDNVGDVLSTSALHVELMERGATEWVAEALGSDAEPGPTRERYLVCDLAADAAACTRRVIEGFALRAWRRPATEAELTRLLRIADAARTSGESAESAARLAMVAALVSPHFLYRVELDPAGSTADAHVLSDYELASRLSYFLWASAPDDALLDRAARGELGTDEALIDEVERMLDDPRASSLTDDFAGQWLYSRLVDEHAVDAAVYPDWSPELARSARREIELFFEDFLGSERPVQDMLSADFSFVDARLAAHYGMDAPDATGDEDGFVRVTLPEERHTGVLGRAGILAVTSQPNRTSPVKRGVWVLEQLLCFHPPPPPPDVEGLDSTEPRPGETLRERFERHRADPVCSSCHQVMDPIGFGLEQFDGVGAFRTEDQGALIDPSGELLGGIPFDGAVELAGALSADARFPRCVSRQLLTYATGRGMRDEDQTWIFAITERAAREGGSLRDVITQVVLSPPFRMRTPEVTP